MGRRDQRGCSRPLSFTLALVVATGLVLWQGRTAVGGNEAPWSSSPPVITGTPMEGGTLTVSSGSWHGAQIVFTYTWERCGATAAVCVPILGAMTQSPGASDSYVLTQADVGTEIEVVVAAANPAGSAVAASSRTAVVGATGPQVAQGALQSFAVWSPAVEHAQPVYVYLPPGYDPARRPGYPVLYLLHGYPGGPGSFVGGVPAGPTEDVLLAQGLMRPTILVMPLGAPSTSTETSWANGVGPDSAWETFLAQDVVGWIDSHFDTVRAASGRGVAGLSDGGYGALNIAMHNPSEFGVVESWSGYTYADPTETLVYGTDPRALAYNSPAQTLPGAAATLRRAGVFLWLTVGWQDPERFENAQFASELAAAGIPFELTFAPGSHLPSFYHSILPTALETMSLHLGATARPRTTPPLSGRETTLRFTVAQRGAPNAPPIAGITTMQVVGTGTLVFARPLSSIADSSIAAPHARGAVRVTVGTNRLRLALDPNATLARTPGPQSTTLMSLPVTVTASDDPNCPEGAHGFVDLEQATDTAANVTNTVTVDLRSRGCLQVGFDNAPWKNLTGSTIRLSFHGATK